MAGDRNDTDDTLYARMLKLAREGRPPSGAADGEPPGLKSAAASESRPASAASEPESGPEAAAEPDSGGMADRSVSSVLARLDARKAAMSGASTAGVPVSNRPLDAIVEDVLRPILTEWLDRNLERVVRDQVDAALQAEVAARERNGSSDS